MIASIEEQGKLTEELRKQILAAETLVVVEDLYRPYRPKRRTRAMIAREQGLEPLANLILLQKMTVSSAGGGRAKYIVSEEKEVTYGRRMRWTEPCDIIAELISDDADYRIRIRELTDEEGADPLCGKGSRGGERLRDVL